jgi:cobyrinic acid a,c-diamide synthase
MKHAVVIAGTHTGVGKTSITCALMAAQVRRGLTVQGFKVGPDFIDTGFHTVATGRPAQNLDGWMISRADNIALFNRSLNDAQAGIVEGVMGLFDGASGSDESGSTAEMAKWLKLPVILVIDAEALARSAAAIVHGFESFDKDVNVAGVIANRVYGPGHYAYIRDSISSKCRAELLGWLPPEDSISIPSRHLGLFTASEVLNDEKLNIMAKWIEEGINIDRLLELSSIEHEFTPYPGRSDKEPVPIGVAKDNAFAFYYQENLRLLESYGAELHFWSPLKERVPENLQGLYFGGGYPELYAGELSQRVSTLDQVRSYVHEGGVVYAECGGLMYLTNSIIDSSEKEFRMAGILPTTARMKNRLAAIGYTEIESRSSDIPLTNGASARGHQFRWSDIDSVPNDIERTYVVKKRSSDHSGYEGYRIRNCLMSYIHLHFSSNPSFAENFVNLCRESSIRT